MSEKPETIRGFIAIRSLRRSHTAIFITTSDHTSAQDFDTVGRNDRLRAVPKLFFCSVFVKLFSPIWPWIDSGLRFLPIPSPHLIRLRR